MRVMIVLVAVAALAALGWTFLDPGGTAPEPGPDPALREDGHAPTLRAAGRPEEAAGAEANAGSATAPGAGDVDPATGHLVRGRIEGLDPTALAQTVVRVFALREYDWRMPDVAAVVGTPRGDGTFALPVGTWRDQHDTVARVRVEVDHPAYVVSGIPVDLAPRGAPHTQVPDTIRLRRAIRLAVTVHGADGEPLADAPVAAYRMKGALVALGPDHDAASLATGKTDATGRIVLRLGAGGAVLIAATAPGHAPAMARRDLLGGATPAPVELTLAVGLTVTGRVLLDGQPVEAAHVGIDPRVDGPSITLRWLGARQVADAILPDAPAAKTDAEGRFEITGLPARPHGIYVQSVEGMFVQRSLHAWALQEVTPPESDVVFDLVAARLEVRVMEGTSPVKDASVFVRQGTKGGSTTSSTGTHDGRIVLLLPPDRAVTIGATHEHRDTVERRIEPLGPGGRATEVLELAPPRPTATLRVRLVDPQGAPVTRAGFRVVAASAADHERYHGFDDGLGLRAAADGVYVLEELEPGAATVFVYPERAPDAHTGTWLALTADVVLVAEREAEVALTARQGAAVSVTVKAPDGTPLGASATLRDARGEEVDVSWFWSDEDSASMSTGGPGAPNARILPPLPPGDYSLEVAAPGHASRTVRFSVTMGEHKPLEIRLDKQ